MSREQPGLPTPICLIFSTCTVVFVSSIVLYTIKKEYVRMVWRYSGQVSKFRKQKVRSSVGKVSPVAFSTESFVGHRRNLNFGTINQDSYYHSAIIAGQSFTLN